MVRKLVISAICALAAVAALAEDTRPFEPLFVEGKSWKYQYSKGLSPEMNDIHTYTISGDTIVDGRECKRLVFHAEYGKCKWMYHSYAVYEDGGKSFVFDGYTKSFSFLFDFTVKPGDILKHELTVNAIEEIEIRGYQRRKIVLSNNTYWLEGIGSTHWSYTMTPREWIPDGSGEAFIECSQNGEVILTWEDAGLEPPMAGVESVAIEDAQGAGVIFDIHGRRVEHPQRGHIYIRDGRKFVQQ